MIVWPLVSAALSLFLIHVTPAPTLYVRSTRFLSSKTWRRSSRESFFPSVPSPHVNARESDLYFRGLRGVPPRSLTRLFRRYYPPLSLTFSRLSFPKCAGFLSGRAARPRAIISRGNLSVEFEGSAYIFPRRRAPLITKHGRDFISHLGEIFFRGGVAGGSVAPIRYDFPAINARYYR